MESLQLYLESLDAGNPLLQGVTAAIPGVPSYRESLATLNPSLQEIPRYRKSLATGNPSLYGVPEDIPGVLKAIEIPKIQGVSRYRESLDTGSL